MLLQRRSKRRKHRWKNQFPPRRARKPKQGSLFGDLGPDYRRFRVPGLSPSLAKRQLTSERGGSLPEERAEYPAYPSPPFGWRQILGRMRQIKMVAWEIAHDPEIQARFSQRDIGMLMEEALSGASWAEISRLASALVREWEEWEQRAALEAVGEVSDEEEKRVLTENGVALGEDAPF